MVQRLIAIGIWYVVERTDFGARLRASVDNPRMARCAGINVRRIFSFTFAVGCGLAAVGGVLGTQMLPIEPYYALNYLILVLIVVATGGLGSLKGSFGAGADHRRHRHLWPLHSAERRRLRDVCDRAGGAAGAAARPVREGLTMATISAAPARVVASMRNAFAAHRINWIDVGIWVVAIGAYFVVPTYLSLGTTVLIMILFTLSLDLAVGYGGIDTLGQGAFFGVGGYAAAFWALNVTGEPISGLVVGGRRRRAPGRRHRPDHSAHARPDADHAHARHHLDAAGIRGDGEIDHRRR